MQDPLALVIEDLHQQAWLLCFDEFQAGFACLPPPPLAACRPPRLVSFLVFAVDGVGMYVCGWGCIYNHMSGPLGRGGLA